MRSLGMILGVIAAVAAPAAPVKRPATKPTAAKVIAKPLPVFSFMGQDTETRSTMTALDGAPCKTTGALTECTKYFGPQIAGVPMNWMWMKYNDGKLFSVYAEMGELAVGEVLLAFVAKYGPPDRVESRKWESKGGASFDNKVSIWDFKGGHLELSPMALKVDEGSFEFSSDANSPPADKPKVDF